MKKTLGVQIVVAPTVCIYIIAGIVLYWLKNLPRQPAFSHKGHLMQGGILASKKDNNEGHN